MEMLFFSYSSSKLGGHKLLLVTKSGKRYAWERIYLVTGDGSSYQKAFYKVKDFFYSLRWLSHIKPLTPGIH